MSDFKTYGQGKRKLFKLKLEDLMERENISFDEDDRDFLDRLREQVNQDTMEEFQKIDLGGSFSGRNIREMATETELADLYSLTYQPLSTEAHGEWGKPNRLRPRPLWQPAAQISPTRPLRYRRHPEYPRRLVAGRVRDRP